jgi:predicted phage-related endonuclease
MPQANLKTSIQGPRITNADWTEIRRATIAAHETASLFESVAETVETGEDHDDFEDDIGNPIGAYGSPLSLWEMKTGRYTESTNRGPGLWSKIKWGVISLAAQEKGLETRRPEGVYLHPQMDFMSSRLDMEGSEDGGATWDPIISYNVAGTLADTWRNATGAWTPPEHVRIAAQHHMAVSGAARCFVVALFGGVSIKTFVLERDEELIEDIEATIESFWSCVVENRRPASSGARDAAVLNRLCSQIDPETEVVDMRKNPEFLELIERKESLSAERNKLDKEVKAINAQITEMMDGVGSAIISETRQYSWVEVAEKEEPAKIKPGYAYCRARKIDAKNAGTKLLDLLNR